MGFLTGLVLGFNFICLYLICKTKKALQDKKLLKEMYIKEYDERERFIKLKSASFLISILAVGIFIVCPAKYVSSLVKLLPSNR